MMVTVKETETTKMLDSSSHNSSARSFVISAFVLIFLLACIALNYLWYYRYQSEAVYIEPISSAQVLIRQSKDDEILSLVSLYNILYVGKDFESAILKPNSATISLDSVTRDYSSGAFSPKAFTISGTTADISIKLTGALTDKRLSLTATTTPFRTFPNTATLLGFQFTDLPYKIVTRESNTITIQDSSCKQTLRISKGKYFESRKDLAFFELEDNKLEVTIDYECTR